MSRINTNIPSMIAARVFAAQNERLNQSLERLSTGLRINRGKDDPAGLIASERLRTDIRAIGAAISNARRADNIISTAEGALNEVGNLIIEIEYLVDRSANEAGLSSDEVAANQLQIDSILDSINRIANSTAFAGNKLLNGTYDYSLSSVTAADLAAVTVNSSRIADGGTRTVVVNVTTSAQTAQLNYASSGVAAGSISLEIGGNLGTEQFTFAGSSLNSVIVTTVNAAKDLTGVSASLSGTALRFDSTSYGSDQFVSVSTISGAFTVTGGTGGRDTGVDVVANINGQSVTGSGLDLKLNTSSLSVDITLASAFAQQTASASTFGVTGGGATFSLAPELGLVGRQSIGLASVTTGNLGKTGVGFLSTLGSGQTNALNQKNFLTSQRLIREASTKVASLRGRLGSFQKDTIGSTIRSLQIALENTKAAESAIRDTDFATETSNLTRAQILVAASTATLGLANSAPQSVLSLLG